MTMCSSLARTANSAGSQKCSRSFSAFFPQSLVIFPFHPSSFKMEVTAGTVSSGKAPPFRRFAGSERRRVGPAPARSHFSDARVIHYMILHFGMIPEKVGIWKKL